MKIQLTKNGIYFIKTGSQVKGFRLHFFRYEFGFWYGFKNLFKFLRVE